LHLLENVRKIKATVQTFIYGNLLSIVDTRGTYQSGNMSAILKSRPQMATDATSRVLSTYIDGRKHNLSGFFFACASVPLHMLRIYALLKNLDNNRFYQLRVNEMFHIAISPFCNQLNPLMKIIP